MSANGTPYDELDALDARPELTAELQERLARSTANRRAMEKRFGFVPLSVLEIARGALSRSLFHYANERGKRTTKGDRAERGGVYADKRLRLSGGGSRSADGRAWSVMPGELVQFFIQYYASPGDVYLDPFMGQGVQLQIAKRMGLHYYGYDLSEEFVQYIQLVRDKIDDGATTLKAYHGDSRRPDAIPDAIGDFGFTSPPYWDLEFYGDDPAQLGYGQSYSAFLQGLQDVARAWRPKFKRGAWFVVNVNDFRKDGQFYPYHADTIAAFAGAGWTLVDLWIISGLVGGLPQAFAVDFNLKRTAPKVHEYALVFRNDP